MLASQYHALEPRRLLAVITVDTIADDLSPVLDGKISFREAITAANTNASFGDAPAGDSARDFIQFAPEITGQTITLAGAELMLTGDVVIRASNVGMTIDAGGQSRIFSVDSSQRVAFSNLTLTGGNALEGGAVLARGGGQVQFFGSTVRNNRATAAFSGGGGIFNLDSDVLMANSDVGNNFTHGAGGGIFSASGVVHLHDSDFFVNTAYRGGGIAIGEGALYAFLVDIRSNMLNYDPTAADRSAETEGLIGNVLPQGQVNLAGGGVAMLGTDASSVIRNSRVRRNVADNGGGIWNAEGNRVYLYTGTRIASNTARGQGPRSLGRTGGGGIYNLGLVLMNRISLSGNEAQGFPTGAGGAILDHGGRLFIHMSTFFDNSTDDDGGAIYARDTRLTITGTGFSQNTAGPFSAVTPHQAPQGGAIRLVGSANAVIGNSFFQSNTAGEFGGAISNSGTLRINASRFLDNTAQAADPAIGIGGGGAIFNEGGTLDVYASTLESNVALRNVSLGGAIFSAAGRVNIGNSSFYSNLSEGAGGALAITGGEAVVFESTFGADGDGQGNLARLSLESGQTSSFTGNLGGAIFVDGTPGSVTSLLLQGSQIVNNTARNAGGGLWAGSETRVRVFSSQLQPTRFTNNRAFANDGGGVLSRSNDAKIVDAMFSGNTARHGGGVFADGGRLTLVSSQLTSNEARRFGDDLYDDAEFFRNIGSTIEHLFGA